MSPLSVLDLPFHDDGLAHNHGWAGGQRADGEPVPRDHGLVADPAAVPTPSSAVHDDAHYGI